MAQTTKARFASFYDANANLPTLVDGVLSVPGDDGTGGVVSGDFSISMKDIITSSYEAYNGGVDVIVNVTTPPIAEGVKHVITIVYPDSRQLTRKSFVVYEAAGETASTLSAKFADSINAHGVFSATDQTGSVDFTWSEGLPIRVTASEGFVVTNPTPFQEAIGVPADLDFDGLSGYAPGNTYGVVEIEHYVDVPSGTNKKTIERSRAISRVYLTMGLVSANFANAVADSLGDILSGGHGGNATGVEYLDTGAVIA